MNTFLDTFEDRDEYGRRIDNDYNGILQTLEDHCNYLKRVPKKRPGLSQHLNLKLKHRRTLQSVKSGINPISLPVGSWCRDIAE